MVMMASIVAPGVALAQGAGAPSVPPGPSTPDPSRPGFSGPGTPIDLGGVAKPRPMVRFGEDRAIGMDVVDGRRGVRRSQAQIRYCYERVLSANPTLQGRLQLTITVDEEGHVTNATTTAFDKTVDACLAARAKTWRFAKPTEERGVYIVWIGFAPDDDGRASVGGRFDDRNAPLSDPGVVVAYGTPAITGGLDAKRAARVVASGIRAHEYCFASIDAMTPAGIGTTRTTLSIEVDGAGAITSTTLTGLDLPLAACLHRRVQQLSFPPPADGRPAGIAIQVTFKKKPSKK